MKSLLSFALSLSLLIPAFTVPSAAKSGDAQTGSKAGTTQELRQSAELAAQKSRKGGLLGFEGKYTLKETDRKVSVIVELNREPVKVAQAVARAEGKTPASTKKLKAEASGEKKAFLKSLGEITSAHAGESYQITADYTTAMNGVAVTVAQRYVDDLAALPTVFAVYPNKTYQLPAETGTAGGDNAVGMEDSRAYFNADALNATYDGAGVTVGVIDSGVDYNHPDLQGAFSNKLPDGNAPAAKDLKDGHFYGRNYISNGNDANNPMDDHGHGTHVCGIIAARGVNNGGFSSKGMAPGATLVMYKALDKDNRYQQQDVLKAMQDATADGCRILSMSLGDSDLTDNANPSSIAMNNLAISYPSTLFVLCAGNNGPSAYTLWSPGTSPMVLTVANATLPSPDRLVTLQREGAADASKLRLVRGGWADQVKTGGGKVSMSALTADNDGKCKMVLLPTVDGSGLGTGTEEEFASFFKDKNAKDYTGALFVLSRGQNFDNTVARVKKYCTSGAVLVLNTQARQNDFDNISFWQGYFNNYLPVFTMNYTEGQSLLSGLTAGQTYRFALIGAENLSTTASAAKGGVMPNDSSSRGPVTDQYDLKPDLAAPGTQIVSTARKGYSDTADYTETDYTHAYTSMTGTSMATPHVSAFAALLLQKKSSLTALELKSLLVNTANSDAFSDSVSRYTVGAGMVNPQAALDAVDAGVTMTAENHHVYTDLETATSCQTPTISFDAAEGGTAAVRTATVTVTNAGSSDHTYTISAAACAYFPESGQTGSASAVTFSLSKNSVTVPAGQSATFTLTANVSAEAQLGSYETLLTLAEGGKTLVSPAAVYVYREMPFDALDESMTFLHSAVLSSGSAMQLKQFGYYGSDRTLFQFRFHDKILSWQPLLYGTDGRLLGCIDGAYQDAWGTGDWYYWDSIGSWYTPCTLADDGTVNKTGKTAAVPEGAYQVRLLLKGGRAAQQTGNVVVPVAELYIDNTLPTIQAGDAAHTQWAGTPQGDSVVFSGNIYDAGTAAMEKAGVNSAADQRVFGKTTSQSDNVVVVRAGGKDYRAAVTASGSFTVALPKSAASGKAAVYYGDHFLPQGSETKADYFKDGFDPENLSYTVEQSADSVPWMKYFGYRAANMAQFETQLTIANSIPVPSVTPAVPAAAEKPVTVETQKNSDGSFSVSLKSDGKETAASAPQTVKIENTGAAPTACAYEVLPDGTERPVTRSCVKDGTLYLATDHSAKIVLREAKNTFTDLQNQWSADAALFAVSHGLMNGVTAEQFAPEAVLTRGMLVTMLYRLSGSPAVSGTTSFRDVSTDSYCAAAVQWAAQNGITLGTAAGGFAPNVPVSREAIALLMYRYAGYEKTARTAGDAGTFWDASHISDSAREAVQWAAGAKIVTGRTDGSFDPAASAERGEAAAMTMRLVQWMLSQSN